MDRATYLRRLREAEGPEEREAVIWMWNQGSTWDRMSGFERALAGVVFVFGFLLPPILVLIRL